MKPVLIALTAVTLLAACQRNAQEAGQAPPAEAPEAQPHTDPQVTPAEQAAPLTYSRDTAYADVELTLPQAIAAYPDLHAAIYGEEVRGLREFLEGAQSDHTEYTGEEGIQPYMREVTYEVAGQTARLFSLRETEFEYTGGAHSNTGFGAVLWDKTRDRRLQPASLFRAGADLSPLDQALCSAINTARAEATGEPSNLTIGDSADWSCPRASQIPFVLAPSTTEGRAGGLEFLIGPYQVGPYAEGTYQIVVPQSAFRSLVDPAFAADFAGQPPRSGRVSSQDPVTQAR
ncbi:MAG TPA: DUF4163 domain-containing protein [Brevundimonas sp.]|uniref:DUF3298 and DUF4163 domain-containing protein n=1 Tax=Brevundimonas sp. TaxID=1871086 RepID=UPI002BC23723|nr:DUF4163 domain-containing protein [Brevundimonas sp.]HRH20753.1 DUF4163 domain-containing protein [Brevundimonas sp.]